MKILFSSYVFYPSVGGIESVSAILADKFVEAGHDVELITETPGEDVPGARYQIRRRPSFWTLLRLLFWSDLLFQNNISLRSLMLAMCLGKHVIVVHQTWIQNTSGEIGWSGRIKRMLLRHVTNVAISRAVLDHIKTSGVIIANPHDDRVFRLLPNITRDKTMVFLGRLVSDKGVDLLLHAIKILQSDGLASEVTIIGEGPEKENLRRLVHELGLDRQITFVGEKSGNVLAELLNRHRILVVPSRWAEPFGVVALEGIACGCVVVGSESGGLKEAIGPCGLTFENGNERALAKCLKELLVDPDREATLRKAAPQHLARFRADMVAVAYLELLQKAVA